jgi:hypothetical protein
MTATTTTRTGENYSLRQLRVILDPRTGLPSTNSRLYYKVGWDDFMAALGCPACDCTKSNDESEPNGYTEACEDGDCKCHAEDLCLDCEEPVDDREASFHTGCCSHKSVDTDDIADGVAGGGRMHVYVTTCRDCKGDLALSAPDEDGECGWEVIE